MKRIRMVLLLRPPHGRGVTPRQAKSMYVGIPGEGFNQAPVLARHGGVSLTLCPWRRAEGVDAADGPFTTVDSRK